MTWTVTFRGVAADVEQFSFINMTAQVLHTMYANGSEGDGGCGILGVSG